jgi:hypothetical protein
MDEDRQLVFLALRDARALRIRDGWKLVDLLEAKPPGMVSQKWSAVLQYWGKRGYYRSVGRPRRGEINLGWVDGGS